jgi:uncharacterized membrane protein YcjF (UPF0283 family)
MHADVFFFVSTILLTILALVFIVAIVYLVSVISEVKAIVRIVRRETESAAADLTALRAKIKEGKFMPAGLMAFITGFLRRRKRKPNSK